MQISNDLFTNIEVFKPFYGKAIFFGLVGQFGSIELIGPSGEIARILENTDRFAPIKGLERCFSAFSSR